MRLFAILLTVFGLIVIYNPDIIAYLLGWLLVFIGINMLAISFVFPKKKKDSYVKFGSYKIFRDK